MSRSLSPPTEATPRRTWRRSTLWLGLAKRWLLGTHHGAARQKRLPAQLDAFVFRFYRRTAKNLSHRFGLVIEHAVRIARPPPTADSSAKPDRRRYAVERKGRA